MIRLFIKFSLLTLVLGFACRWTFYRLLDGQVYTDRERVFAGMTEVQIGGLNVLASELANADTSTRASRLPRVRTIASQALNTAMGLWLTCILGMTGWLVYSLASKFRRIEEAARNIAEGLFDARVDESKAGESIVLANAFNLMAAKTESSIRAKKELQQVISHELRTPLSRLRFAVELLNVSKDEQ